MSGEHNLPAQRVMPTLRMAGDEYRLIVNPVILGSGTPLLQDVARQDLELVETQRFGSGAVLLVYRPGSSKSHR